MTNKKLQQLIQARNKNNLPELVLKESFPKQLEFIKDPSKRKAAFVLRRGGKSTAFGIYLIHEALKNPITKSLYMAQTKEKAENIMWMNIIEPILLKLNIPHKFNKSRRIVSFENKSTIQLTGADASEKQITSYLGGKYVLAIFDECQDIQHDLKHWVDDMLGPAMLDYGGTICCAGTAGRSIGRYWYDITQPLSQITSWSIHKWSAEDNIHMSEKLINEMNRLIKDEPGIEKTEGFKNQYLCEWVIDNSNRTYHNGPENILTDEALINSLINCDKKWFYMIGFDFGFEDDTAYVVGAFSKHDKNAYIVETFKKPKMITEELAEKLQQLKRKYNPIHIVGDCQNKTLVQTLRQQYKLPLRPAEKLGKEAHIAQMNSDFTMNKIKVIKHLNEDLVTEWNTLVWDEKKRLVGEFKELASKDNHAADACLIKGTKIITINGNKNIEDIKIGDLVLTRNGYQKVIDCGISGIKPIFTLKTKLGKELSGTFNHPVFQKNKFINLSSLKTGDILTYTYEQQEQICQKVLNLNTTELHIVDIQNQKTEAQDFIGQPAQIGYTELYGRKILEKFQMDITFITLIKTPLIMIYQILNLCQKKITYGFMQMKKQKYKKKMIENNLNQLMIWLKNGIVLQKELSGIVSTVKNHGKIENFMNTPVLCAENYIKQDQKIQMFAATTVFRNKGENQEKTTKQENVSFVNKNFGATNTQRKSFVVDRVMTIVENQINQTVYNLTVENEPEYFANGILVHNCLYLHHFSKHFNATPEPEIDPNPMRTFAETQLKKQLNVNINAYDQEDYNIYDRIKEIF